MMSYKQSIKLILIVILSAITISIFTGCVKKIDNTTQMKLQFLNELDRKKVNFTEEEKIERIMAFFRKKLANIGDLQLKFIEKIKANEGMDFDAYIFEFKMGKEIQKEIVFVKDNFFFSDFANLETFETSSEKTQRILEREQNKTILAELKKDSEYIISLGLGKKEYYVFSDPLCSFCREHLKNIDEKFIRENTIHFIFTSVHSDAGYKRAGLIYENIDNAKSDLEKLNTIKAYYADDISQELIFEQSAKNIESLSKKYSELGVRYVPYIIEIK